MNSLKKILEDSPNPDTYRDVLGEIIEDLKTVTRFKIDGMEGWLKIEGIGSFDAALVRNIYYDKNVGIADGIDPENAPRIIIFDGESNYWKDEDEDEEYQQYLWNESSKKAN